MSHMKTAAFKSPKAKPIRKPGAAAKNGLRSPRDLVKVVQDGIAFSELETLRTDLDLPLDQLAAKLGMARATLHRRKLSGRLGPDESDKVLRFARLVGQAEQVLGGGDEARQWLSYPQHGLGGAVPLDYARTEVGAREVENLLGRIEHGVYS